MKTRTSEKKRQPFQWKKMFDQFFPYYRAYKHSRNTLWRSIRYSDIYCGFHKSIFQDLRGCWKHKFLKKRQHFQWRKHFGLHFPVLSNTTYVRKVFFQGRQALLITTVELIRAFSSDERGRWKHNFWRKRQPFQWKNNIWPVLPRIIVYDKPQGIIYKSPQAILTNTVWIIGESFWDPKGCWKHKFLKKKEIFSLKKIWRLFSRFIERHRAQETIYKGRKAIFANASKVIRAFFRK